jgi:fatty-acyl-CoA synthase
MVIGNLVALNYGASMIYPSEGFDTVSALKCVSKYKATLLYGVPTMFIAYLDYLQNHKGSFDTSSLRSGFIAGAGCPAALMERIIKELNIPDFTTGYGLTECSPVFFMCKSSDSIEKKSLTVGKISHSSEAKIVDPDTGKTLKWGEVGEICAKGYFVMKGYWGDEVKTKETISSDGWIKTGDIGALDEDGYL